VLKEAGGTPASYRTVTRRLLHPALITGFLGETNLTLECQLRSLEAEVMASRHGWYFAVYRCYEVSR
jgi:hypothetical protein